MATDLNTTLDWFRELLDGRSDEEIETIKRIAEAMVAPIETLDEPAQPPCPTPGRTEGRRRFALAYSRWLGARAVTQDPRTSEEALEDAIDRETEAVCALIDERAWYDGQIWQKLSLLDHYLGEPHGSWPDGRCIRLLASITSDLRTHGISSAACS
jgi:hypothetical protein